MKTSSKLFMAILMVSAVFISNRSSGQTVEKSNLRFGIGVDGLLPVGNSTNAFNFGLGITPRLQYSLSDRLALTLTSGLYHFFPKTITYPTAGGQTTSIKYKSDIIPVKVGAKYFLGSNFYLGAEVGLGFELAKENRFVHFIASPSVGYSSKNWDIGFRYESLSGNGYSDGVVGLRAAYGFGL